MTQSAREIRRLEKHLVQVQDESVRLRARVAMLVAALREAQEYVHLWMEDNTSERELAALERIEAALAVDETA